MSVTWNPSADRHGITHEETLYAMLHNYLHVPRFEEPREGHGKAPDLFIGPSRFGALEVMAVVEPGSVRVFHVMRLRETTRRIAVERFGYTEEDQT